MKAILVVSILVLVAISGSAQTPPKGSPIQSGAAASSVPAQTPEELARNYIELWNSGDSGKIKAFPPFAMNSVAGRVLVNPPMLASVIGHWRTSMPDLHFEVKDTLVEGNKVAMRTVFTGTYKARLFAYTADPKSLGSDRRIRETDLLIFAIKDGRIVEVWEEYNVARVQEQMGAKWCNDVMSTAAPPIAPSQPETQTQPSTTSPPPSKP